MGADVRVVCTAVVGGYELLTEQPVARESAVRFVCFTDDPALRSSSWEVVAVEPRWPMDPVRSARDVKIRLDRYLPEAGQALWIDNSVQLHALPEVLLDQWLSDVDLAVPRHSFRATVLDEFAEVSTLGLDDVVRVYEQEAHYRAVDPDALAEPLLWTGILARRMTAATRTFCSLWMEQVLRYSRRDQLSINYAVRRTSVPHRVVALDNVASDLHRWPVAGGRLPDRQRRHFSAGFIPQEVARATCEAQLRALRLELDEQRARLRQVDRERVDLQSSASRLGGLLGTLGSAAEQEVARLQSSDRALTRVLQSRSYRWTAGLRRAAGYLPPFGR